MIEVRIKVVGNMKSRVSIIPTGAGERARLLWKDACNEPRNRWSGCLDSEGKGGRIAAKLGEYFVWGQNRDREGLFNRCARSLFLFFFIDPSTLLCWRPHRLTHHLSEDQNRLVASRCCDPRKQSALKQSTEHFVWSTFWNTGKVKLELTAPIETRRPSEAWPSLVYFVFFRDWLFRGLSRMNIPKLGCHESAKRMVIVDIANMWRLALLCKRGIIMGAFSSL